jgi:hypothetical protein
MSSYLNSPVNEMLTVLRADDDSNIYPFLVVRQVPLTTDEGANAAAKVLLQPDKDDPDSEGEWVVEKQNVELGERKIPATAFMELPRWVVAPGLVFDADIGRSDQPRVNMCYVYGSGPGSPVDEVKSFHLAPPIKDDLDILRNGVRPYMPSVNVLLVDGNLGPSNWRDFMADISMSLHLTLNGTMSISGVRAPIAPGDNLEYEGIVYHIESVTHTFRLDSSTGNRHFQTSLNLSNGRYDSLAGGKTARSEEFPNITETNNERPSISSASETE